MTDAPGTGRRRSKRRRDGYAVLLAGRSTSNGHLPAAESACTSLRSARTCARILRPESPDHTTIARARLTGKLRAPLYIPLPHAVLHCLLLDRLSSGLPLISVRRWPLPFLVVLDTLASIGYVLKQRDLIWRLAHHAVGDSGSDATAFAPAGAVETYRRGLARAIGAARADLACRRLMCSICGSLCNSFCVSPPLCSRPTTCSVGHC